MSIIKPKQHIIIPPHIIKEEIDRVHRQDWEDPDRYERQKQKALRYIPVRSSEIKAWEQLVRETARIFHDDLAADPDIKEAAQRACWAAEQHQHEQDTLNVAPLPATESADREPHDEPRGEVRGVDTSEATIERLEWQAKEEQDD